MSTKKYLPHRYWQDRRAELAHDVQTMDNQQLAVKHGTTVKRISNILSKFGIRAKNQKIDWLARVEELKTLAATHTPEQLAVHFGTNTENMYSALHRNGVSALLAVPVTGLATRTNELKRLAPAMSEAQLAAHFECSQLTVRRHLKRNGLKCMRPQRESAEGRWLERKPEILSLIACGHRVTALSQHFNVDPGHMRKVLARLGVTIGRLPSMPQASAPMPRKRVQQPKLKQAVLHAVPSGSIKPQASNKTPVEIIFPADVKVTIVEFCPPPGARLCNGSSTRPYNPNARTVSVRSSY